jgi:protein-S-isoprenylcysteine O-methyltransferase Ste14
MAGKKVLPPTYLLIAIVVMAAIHFVLPITQVIPGLWRLIGLLPLAGGIGLNLMADRALHQANSTVKPYEASTTLITTGVFQMSRHPMYLGFVLILIGLAVLLGSLIPYLVIPIFAILMDRIFIQTEERMLKEQFGQTWFTYTARVRRWI